MANYQKIKIAMVKFVAHYLPGKPTMYRATVKTQNVIRDAKLIQNIADHASLPTPLTEAILDSLNGAVNDYLAAGHPVQIENLCTFKPKVRSKGKDSLKKINAKRYRAKYDAQGKLIEENDGCIKVVTLQAWPIGDTKRMIEDFRFEIVGTVEGEDPEEDEEDEE